MHLLNLSRDSWDLVLFYNCPQFSEFLHFSRSVITKLMGLFLTCFTINDRHESAVAQRVHISDVLVILARKKS